MAALEGDEVFDLQDSSSIGSETQNDIAYETESASESESDEYSDSDYMGDDEESSSKPRNRHPGDRPSDRQHRSILASTTLSRAQQITQENIPAETSLFTFLDHKCYTCSCHIPSSHKKRCMVLGFFRLLFLQSCNAIFCPLHNCIIPASKLEHHLHKAHKEWMSPQKGKESRKMASHIATTCGLDTSQEADDVVAQLPDELEEPLVSKGIFRCYQCPFCPSWLGENTGPGTPGRYLRKHMKEHHGDKMEVDVGEPRWTYRVAIYPQASTHVFMLPDEWTPEDVGDGGDSHSDVSIPPLPSLSTHPDQSSIAITTTQDWPIHLGWESYASEIKAGAHIKELKKLIGPSKSCKDGGLTNFLEKGLYYVRRFSIKYMKGAGLIMKDSVIHLGRVLVSEYSLSPFQVVGDSTIIGYSKFLFMTVAMLLRHIDAILAERASDYGPFKLRGVKPQFKAALTLYQLFLTTGGDDLDPQADWAIHNLFQTLLCPEGSNDRTINYPTDQAIFLWAFLSNHRYRISSHVQSLLSAAKYCLRCVSLQIARIQVQGDLDSPFFEEIMPKSGTETEAELEEDDGDDGDISSGGERVAVENTADTGAVLEWLNTRLNSFQNSNEVATVFDTSPSSPHGADEGLVPPESNLYDAVKCLRDQWLTWSPNIKHSRTPFGRIHNILHFISRFSYGAGTATQFDFKLDGQIIQYSRDDGIHWHTVNFGQWPELVHFIMDSLEEKITMQLPSGLAPSDLLTSSIEDDLSSNPPHLQPANSTWMNSNAQEFKNRMLSPTEGRHHLISQGKLQQDFLETYLQHDQEIRGLVAALVATTTSVCLRPAQYKSININSGTKQQRNIWLIDGRFLLGKPAAKQRSIDFADTLYWLPRKITHMLSIFFFFQQPFIDDILGVDNGQYAIHLWPLWPSKSNTVVLWSGVHINQAVRKYTKKILNIALDCQTIRQIAEGFLHQKFPHLFEAFNTSGDFLGNRDTYHIDHVLQRYAQHCGLGRLVEPLKIKKDKIAALLMVSDIWQALIKIEPQNEIWLPIATDTFIFPATSHRDLAYVEAQQLREATKLIDEQSLSKGLELLENPNFFNIEHSENSVHSLECARIFLRVVRHLLFGTGGPRYAQRPPLGGVHFQDLVEAGAMILHARDKISDMAPRDDPAYNSILKGLQEAWQEYDSTARSAKISSNIFQISHETSYLSRVAAEGKAMLALEMVKI
ncbi:hypothetical protein F5887DRAFT_1073895 [Amanita rubescens]|nr:hypothetical protein F5887DRAFT_1073895 [Amanita rubescens]